MEFRYFNPVEPTIIDQFEKRNRVRLPNDYRAFLTKFGGGIFKDNYRMVPRLDTPFFLRTLYGFSSSGGYCGNDLDYWQYEERFSLSPGDFIIGNDDFGDLLILNCSEDFYGIYLVDVSCEVENSYTQKLYLITYTFDEFLHGIRPFDYDADQQKRMEHQPVQWPEPLPKEPEDSRSPRKPAIWAPGTHPKFDLSTTPEILRNPQQYKPQDKKQ